MNSKKTVYREGSLEAPTRHPLDWRNPDFFDENALYQEMERVFEICHGCRRCVSLCHAFPSLFDLVDESETMEVDGVHKEDYWKVVEHCYLCDLCYMTKCPYVPPHEWNVDFPHLMLRAKGVRFRQNGPSMRDRILSSTDVVGKIATIPVISESVNAVNRSKPARKLMESVLGIDDEAYLPGYDSRTLHRRMKRHTPLSTTPRAGERTRGKVTLFATCYGSYNEPQISEDLVAILEHNGIPVKLADKEQCCGMPRLELGDFAAIERARDSNIAILKKAVDEGWDILAPVPSCVLMFKQELPLLFPEDSDVIAVSKAIFDPFEYLMLRHREGLFNTEFPRSLGKIAYHVPCHQRVQNIGLKTRDVLQLVPGTEIQVIERCSGHDGTYAVKKEYHALSMKIGKPVMNRVRQMAADHYASDCPIAGHHIENGLQGDKPAEHPISLLRQAYGI